MEIKFMNKDCNFPASKKKRKSFNLNDLVFILFKLHQWANQSLRWPTF